jgi:hypothetical protein
MEVDLDLYRAQYAQNANATHSSLVHGELCISYVAYMST